MTISSCKVAFRPIDQRVSLLKLPARTKRHNMQENTGSGSPSVLRKDKRISVHLFGRSICCTSIDQPLGNMKAATVSGDIFYDL